MKSKLFRFRSVSLYWLIFSSFNQFNNHVNALEKTVEPPTTVEQWQSQLNHSVTTITDIRVQPSDSGIEIVFDTDNNQTPQRIKFNEGNDLIIVLTNAQLETSQANFGEQNLIAGISEVRATNLDENRVRVIISGTDGTPTGEVHRSDRGFTISATPPLPVADSEPDEVINIIVTREIEDDDYDVDEATVGTRTETPIQNIPQSIQAVPQEVIEDQQVTNITDALRNVPGVVPADSNRTLFNNFTIRGFGGGFNFINDVYRRNGLRDSLGASNTGDTANIERIEVLKGPSSVLYGRGSPGGIVNLVTKQPLSDPFYEVSGEIGNYNFYRGTIDLSGPLNKNVLYRLNVAAETSESFIDFYDRDRYLVNPVLAWNISDDTKLSLEFEYRSVRSLNDAGLPAVGTVLDNPNGDISLDRYTGEPDLDNQDTNTYRIGYNFEHKFNDNWRIRNAFDTVLSRSNSLRIINGSLDPDGRTLNRNYFDNGDGFDVNAYTLDTYTVGKFNTGKIKHELVAGIELSRNEVRSNNTFFVPAGAGSIDLFAPQYGVATLTEPTRFTNTKRTNDGLGIYIQDQVALSDKFTVVLGGRFDILTNEAEDFNLDTNEFQQNEAFSPRVGVVYKPIEDISLYASYSRSLNQSVGESANGSTFDPGRGTQYEIGIKGDISDRFSATLALYDLTRTNVLTDDPDNPNPQFQIQTGEQNSQGIELSVAGEILPGWNITGGYAYTDAVITEDNTFAEGNRLDNVPENAVSLWTTYRIQQGSIKGLGFGAGLFFVGEREGNLENSFQLPSYTRTDAAIFYERGKFKTALNFRNLFDIDYFEAADDDLEVYPGDPFTVVGNVTVKF